jgi:hypothetical protein
MDYELHEDRLHFSTGPSTNPIFDLLQVFRVDTMAFLDILYSCLQEIGKDSLDDYLMYKHIFHWRTLMNEFQVQVPEIRRDLDSFVKFAYGREDDLPERVKRLLLEVNDSLDSFGTQMDAAYTALRADLSILESKRSLSEAENVTKLTELAFAFIPLTFACSFLALPLVPFPDKLPLKTFIVTAVILASLSYSVRLIIRSNLIELNRRRALEIFWTKADLKPGSKIPAHSLIFLTTKEIWKHRGPALTFSVFIMIFSISVVPIAFLWAKTRLDVGLNVVVTLLVIPFGFAVAWYFTSSAIDATERGERMTSKTSIPIWYRTGIWVARHIPRRKPRGEARQEESAA